MSPSVRELIKGLHQDAPEWTIQLAEMLFDSGTEKSANMAATRAWDFIEMPAVGQGLQKIVGGLSDLRSINELRLTIMQEETLKSIYNEMMASFGDTIDKVKRA